jgi:O-succinylbenzoate synthase
MPRTEHELTVGISGKVESSLQAAIGLTESQLRKLAQATRTMNSMMGKEEHRLLNRRTRTLWPKSGGYGPSVTT